MFVDALTISAFGFTIMGNGFSLYFNNPECFTLSVLGKIYSFFGLFL